jgi:hypothetical protein
LDPIPLLIPPEEWRFIEAGIIQRAQLLNLLLEDIYGVGRLLRCLMTRVRRANSAELTGLFRLHGCFGSPHSTLAKDRPPQARDLENEVVSLMSDAKRPDSLASALAQVQRVGGNLRERLSTDVSRLLVTLSQSSQTAEYIPFVEYPALLRGCVELLSALSRMERENITRGQGWVFMSLGRRLERAMYSVRQLLGLTVGIDEESWPVLEYLFVGSRQFHDLPFTLLHEFAAGDAFTRPHGGGQSGILGTCRCWHGNHVWRSAVMAL